MKKLFHTLNHEKFTFTKISFSDFIYSLMQLWSIVIVLNGMKIKLEFEFESIAGQQWIKSVEEKSPFFIGKWNIFFNKKFRYIFLNFS